MRSAELVYFISEDSLAAGRLYSKKVFVLSFSSIDMIFVSGKWATCDSCAIRC
jgi:hypothetical protein